MKTLLAILALALSGCANVESFSLGGGYGKDRTTGEITVRLRDTRGLAK